MIEMDRKLVESKKMGREKKLERGYSRAENKREMVVTETNGRKKTARKRERGRSIVSREDIGIVYDSRRRLKEIQEQLNSDFQNCDRIGQVVEITIRQNKTPDSGLSLDCLDVVDCVHRIFGYARANVDFDYRKKV